MSKSSRTATPRKGVSSKKNPVTPLRELPKSEVAPSIKEDFPLKLEREDQLTLQLTLSERNNKELQFQLAQKDFEEANLNWSKQLTYINEKYELNPSKDKIDLSTGIIQKG